MFETLILGCMPRDDPPFFKTEGSEKIFGDGGYRSPYLSHAKRALYHLSYVPSYCFNVSITQCDCDCQVAIISHPMRSALLIL